MSMSPDDPDFIQRLMGSFGQGLNSPLMGIAAGLLQAGGPSRMPTSLGQALGAGLQTGQQFQSQGIQNAMQKLQLQQALQGQQYFNNMLNPQQPAQQPQQAPMQPAMPPITGSVSQPGSFDISQGIGATSAQNPAQPAGYAPKQPQVAGSAQIPALMDPTQDAEYQQYVRDGMIAKHFGQDSTALDNKAATRLANLQAQEITLTPEQAKLLTNGNILPGQSVKFKPYTGDWSIVGEPRYKDITYNDTFSGQTLHARMDQATGGVVPFKIPGNGPQKGDLQLQDDQGSFTVPANWATTVKKMAQGDMLMPTLTSKNPQLANNLTRAAVALNPDWRVGDAPAKVALMKSATVGPDKNFFDSGNTIQSHLVTLNKALDALDNGDFQSANKIINWTEAKFGKSAPTNAKAVETIVTRELGKILASGGVMTDADKTEASSTVNSDMAKGQYREAIQYIQQLIGGKMNSVLTRYKANGLDGYFKARLEPEALQALSDFQQQNQPGQSQAPKTLTYDPATGTFK